MKPRFSTLAILPLLLLSLMACSLFGKKAAENSSLPAPIVTATPGAQTAVAISAGPTATGTPTPTLHPLFPTPVLVETWIAEQEFERGWAFALQDRAEIWIAAFDSPGSRGGSWTVYVDEFYLEEQSTGKQLIAEFDQTPPKDEQGRELVMPIRGFGWVWVNNPEVREALGWGVWTEVGYNGTVRYDAGGLINPAGEYVPRPGRYTLVNFGGDVFIFDEATQTFTWEPAS